MPQPMNPEEAASKCEGKEPYALQVTDNSMEPEFPDKCIVIIEPSDKYYNNAYVFIEVEDTRWFRQLIIDENGNKMLVADNPLYPEINLTGLEHKVLGIIIQRNIRRKIKHYHASTVQAPVYLSETGRSQ